MTTRKIKRNIRELSRYKFDSLMSRGTMSLIGFLGIITAIFILVFTIILWLTRLIPEKSFIEIFWISLFRTIDTGMLAEGRIGLLYFILSLIIALVSIFIISILIGLLTTGIGNKIRTLQKGRSKVLEKGHTVILGWSETIFTIVSSLIEASKNQKICRIVIMGNKDKVEMEDAIRERIHLNRNNRIIIRQGNPININDLKILNLPLSKSIIIIEESDSKVLKTILAINNIDKGNRTEPYNIVSVMKKYKNISTGKIAGQGQAKFILNKKFIAELIAHTCHQPGLSIVYTELLSFEGDEIHMRGLKELAGKSFKQILQMFEDSSIIGISSDEKVKLNPSMDTIFKAEDKIIAISASDASIIISEKPDNHHFKEDIIQPSIYKNGNSVQNILILGWNDSGKIIIDELDNYVSKDTRITVMANLDNIGKIFDDYVRLEFIKGDTTDYDFLQEFILREYSHVVVLAYHDIDVQEADSITLMTLIHLRDIAEKNKKNFSITSEILDIQNRDLAKVAKVNDFIVSEKLTSLFLAQLSENEFLNPVFEDLLSDYGSEIYLKNIKNYVLTDVAMNFYTVIEAASRKNDVAIGYQIASEESLENKNFGIYINPIKSSMIKFSDKDNLIILSENIF